MPTSVFMENSKLAEALSKAQGEIKPPQKNRTVDFTDKNGRRVNYSYADLADLIECVRGPLSKNGLCFTHKMEERAEGFGMITQLIHSSGEKLETWYPLPEPTSLRPQEFGSSMTYARRYSLSCLLGVASEEDDDGNSAEAPTPKQKSIVSNPVQSGGHPATPPQPQQSTQPPNAIVTQKQLVRLFAIAREKQWSEEQIKIYLNEAFGLDSTSKLTREKYDLFVRVIETMSFGPAILEIQYNKNAVPEDFNAFVGGQQ